MTHDTPTQCLHIRDNQWRNIVVSRDLGQFVKIRDCPGDSGAVGAYDAVTLNPDIMFFGALPCISNI